ncbi:hypothetical protein [Candidatus Protochlamydia amoebophila]|nr:hypothetical protein [Candidatus Protochlamydia amoebophila]
MIVVPSSSDLEISINNKSYEQAQSFKTNIPFKITLHVLRASTVTYLKKQGFSDGEIMQVTGHASSELVYAYDKGSRADNATKLINLVI